MEPIQPYPGTYLSHLPRELRTELSSFDAYNNVTLLLGLGGIQGTRKLFAERLHITIQRPWFHTSGMVDTDEIPPFLSGTSTKITIRSYPNRECDMYLINDKGRYLITFGDRYMAEMGLDPGVAKILLYKLGLLYENRKKLDEGDEI